MKQTAIKQAIEHIKDLQNKLTSSSQKLGLAQAMDILEDYKEIEKKQIENTFNVGFNVGYNDETSPSYLTAEQYYNEIFTTKQP